MSETPQERIAKWLAEGHWVKEVDEPERGIRDAIRAVLAEQDRLKAGMDRCDLAQHRRGSTRNATASSRTVQAMMCASSAEATGSARSIVAFATLRDSASAEPPREVKP
jgi:hypothetical protein